MAARKPAPPKKKKAAPKTPVLGNDPFARGSAVREVSTQAPPPPREAARPATPELQEAKPVPPVRRVVDRKRPVLQAIDEKPKGGTQPAPRFVPPPPAVTPVRPQPRASPRLIVKTPGGSDALGPLPAAHAAPPGLAVEPRPHAGGPTSHAASPELAVDPRPHAGAPTAQTLSGPTSHAASPGLAVDPRPHAGAPTAQTLSGPTAHAASPSLAVDPRPHAGAPTAHTLSGPTSHAASPGLAVDPRPHAGAPTAQTLSGPTSHAASPTLAVDPRPHAGAPSAQTLSGPTSHAASPTLAVDPRPHAGAPTAQTLIGPTSHAASPSLAVDPRPHAGAPTAQTLSGPTSHAASPGLSVDPRPHAGAPTAHALSGPTSHAASPSLAVDPRPHAGAPTARTLSGPTSHAASPTLAVDPRPHSGAPTAQTVSGPISHAASPSIVVDPRPHAGAPTAQTLSGPTSHAGSPSIVVDPRPHVGAPTTSHSGSPSLTLDPRPHAASSPRAEFALSPTLPSLEARVRSSPSGERETLAPAPAPALASAPTISGALKGLLNAARSSAGLSSRATEVDRWGKDAALSSSLRPLAELLYEKYWRVRVEGAANLPAGPCIIVANHAGALPLDGPVLHLALRRERPDLEESRWLLEDQVFHAPFVGVLANRLGAVRANPENAMRLLEEGRPLIVFPEGFHGLSKPFSERYQLKRFGRGGYVKIALRAGVPIVPAAIIGGEESMPLLGKLPGGLFGVQYLPITLPPLPARWHIRFATPVSMENATAESDRDLAWVERKNLAVRDQIEAMLTDMLQHRERVF